MKKLLLIIILLILPLQVLAEPTRERGISMHQLPKRVADLRSMPWGLQVSYAESLQKEPGQPFLQSEADFVAYVQKQAADVQSNGAWIVVTDPAAYSESELNLIEQIKLAAKRENIPLFICRGKDLPNGWQRFDKAP